MQPTSKADQFEPKWRHFHPQSTVWVQNPFDHDVIYQVADEQNVGYQYRLPANKVSELPGGMIATLGVKEIVDQLIMNDKSDALRIWDKEVRLKYEEKVILRVKDAPAQVASQSEGGEIDLSVTGEGLDLTKPDAATKKPKAPEAFPTLKQKAPKSDVLTQIADASIRGKKDQVVEVD